VSRLGLIILPLELLFGILIGYCISIASCGSSHSLVSTRKDLSGFSLLLRSIDIVMLNAANKIS
jgi:hypothetical protein